MRLLALLAAGLFTGTVIAADDKKDEKKSKDEEAILGTWALDSFDAGDLKGGPSLEEARKIRYTFKKDGKVLIAGVLGDVAEAEYKIDPTAKPKTLDTVRKDHTSLSIYELNGDTPKVCMPITGGKTRPTEFKPDGKTIGVVTFKRVKEEKKVKDEEAIVGTWTVNKFEDGGSGAAPSADQLAKIRMTFKKDGKMTVVQRDVKDLDSVFKLDPAAKPKTIDITGDISTSLGVYELDSDVLKLCMAPGGKSRPAEIKANSKAGVVVMTLKRVQEEKKDK